MTESMDDMISITDAVRLLGLSPDTVRRWAVDGRIAGAVRQSERGRFLVPRSEVERILRKERETRERRSEADLMGTDDAGRLLGKGAVAVAGWARTGKLVGSAKDDTGRWLVRRAERETAVERRIARREEFRTAPRSAHRDDGDAH